MKQIIIKRLVWIALCATLFSFSKIGGESYTIHLNDKLILQHYVASKTTAPSFSLDRAAPTDQLSIYYNECGQIGKERSLTIKDEKDNVLKEWRFANATSEHTPMTCMAKDILALKQKDSNKLKLVYSTRELSKGRMLATIVLTGELKARNQ